MIRIVGLFALLLGSACVGDESVAKYGAAGKVWVLSEIDGKTFLPRATMEFDRSGLISGQAPCNRYSAQQKAPYPWFEAGPAIATKMACPDLKAESMFFQALGEMSLSEVTKNTLILSNDAGRTMIFTAQ